jgi:hypothetical protein
MAEAKSSNRPLQHFGSVVLVMIEGVPFSTKDLCCAMPYHRRYHPAFIKKMMY